MSDRGPAPAAGIVPPQAARRVFGDPRRLLLAGAGILSVAIGAAGIVVPGLPTTIFLIIASYCFTRSCPWLEERLLRRPLFARYMRAIDGGAPMPPRARIAAVLALWASVGISLATLAVARTLPGWLALIIVAAAAAGTAAILRPARPRTRSTA